MASGSENVPKELFEKKQKQRAALKAEYWKQVTNPHRHGTGEGGVLFDAGIQRFMSMKATGYDFFKPTPRTSYWGIIALVLPFGLTMYFFKQSREKKEAIFRSGAISYRDRQFKFI